MIHFEKRLNPSRITTVVTPIIAVILTMIAGGIMFAALGKPPLEAIRIIFGTLVRSKFRILFAPTAACESGATDPNRDWIIDWI